MALTQKVKTYVSDMTLRLGPISVIGDCLPVSLPAKKTKKTYKNVAPDGSAVKQVYVTDKGDQFTVSQLEKAIETEGGMIVIGKDNIADVKAATLPKNVLNLQVYPAQQIDDSLSPADTATYTFEPHSDDPTNMQFYVLLLELLKHSDKAMIGLTNFHGYDGLFRLGVWRNRLTLHKQLYSDDVVLHDEVDTEQKVDKVTLKKGLNVLEKLSVDFDGSKYTNMKVETLNQLEQSVVAGNLVVGTSSPEPVDTGLDIASILDAFEV